jgi:hypothetical protein
MAKACDDLQPSGGGNAAPLKEIMADVAKFGRGVATTAVLLWFTLAGPATAGPPFVTDDPEPTDTGHWEIYSFVQGIQTPGVLAGQGGLDINYGGAKDLQLTAVLPIDFQSGDAPGPGDIQLAAKYRFLHQAEGSWTPDLSVFPRLFVPTAPRRFGEETPSLFLPVWGEKDFGKWSLFGGGGYDIAPGRDNRDFWLSGVTLAREITSRLTLGAEVYHQTPDAPAARTFTGVNLGAIYKLSKFWSLLSAAGPGVQNARQGGQYDFYFALEATY